jgi:hypothetical protein
VLKRAFDVWVLERFMFVYMASLFLYNKRILAIDAFRHLKTNPWFSNRLLRIKVAI